MIKCWYLWDISHKYKNTRKFFFSELYLFRIGVQPINNNVVVSGER